MGESDFVSGARRIRRRILELGLAAGKNGAHLGSGMSSVEILTALYGEVLNLDKIRDQTPDRDRFLLSKGHAAVALYAALEIHGFLTPEETGTFESNGTAYFAHAHRDLARGIPTGHRTPAATSLQRRAHLPAVTQNPRAARREATAAPMLPRGRHRAADGGQHLGWKTPDILGFD